MGCEGCAGSQGLPVLQLLRRARSGVDMSPVWPHGIASNERVMPELQPSRSRRRWYYRADTARPVASELLHSLAWPVSKMTRGDCLRSCLEYIAALLLVATSTCTVTPTPRVPACVCTNLAVWAGTAG